MRFDLLLHLSTVTRLSGNWELNYMVQVVGEAATSSMEKVSKKKVNGTVIHCYSCKAKEGSVEGRQIPSKEDESDSILVADIIFTSFI
ncbi:hypothetical protein E2562_025792 [Oryza meyeriana var. granulata]|uniref:Uncharacterized protein n=1 Tax=Oryza meyeriana var. granulata TaxID=110450 RepID=A0A6G1CRJ3_9ORYZ|nr:hypothetical protein E2562_025792 [Oryza meyeriana var. granulata]